jgi:hypothetical protein
VNVTHQPGLPLPPLTPLPPTPHISIECADCEESAFVVIGEDGAPVSSREIADDFRRQHPDHAVTMRFH